MRVPDEVARSSPTSEKADVERQSKAKRDRIIAIATFAAGVVLLAAAIYFALAAGRQRAVW